MKLPLDPIALAELAEGNQTPDPPLVSHFQAVPDFRREHGRHHNLVDILVIAVCATLADCDSYVEMAEYGLDNQAWLRTFLELPNGIPSHDTFRRVFAHLDPIALQRACVSYGCAAAAQLRRTGQTSATAADGSAATPTTQSNAQIADPVAGNATVQPTACLPAGTPAQTEQQTSSPCIASPLVPAPSITPTVAGITTDCPLEPPAVDAAALPAIEIPQPQQLATPGDAGQAAPPEASAATVPLSSQATVMQPVASQGLDEQRRHLAVDGKTSRGSYDRASGQAALHLVSVWASEERLTLGQVAVEVGSNEITAIPEVLRLVDLEGAVVTIDAIGTQEAIAKQIREGGGDYVLAVKENQPHLYADVLAAFLRHYEQFDGKPYSNELVVLGKGEHGRKEKWTYVVLEDVSDIRDPEKWRDVKRLIMVFRESENSDGTREEESRYFIGSAACGVEAYAKWVRNHWGIENSLHWVLDVVFHEDASRVRKDHGAENLAMLRRLAVSLLGNDKTSKRSIRGKRKKAARNKQYLTHVLFGLQEMGTPVGDLENRSAGLK